MEPSSGHCAPLLPPPFRLAVQHLAENFKSEYFLRNLGVPVRIWALDPSYKGLGPDMTGCDGDQVRVVEEYVRNLE